MAHFPPCSLAPGSPVSLGADVVITPIYPHNFENYASLFKLKYDTVEETTIPTYIIPQMLHALNLHLAWGREELKRRMINESGCLPES